MKEIIRIYRIYQCPRCEHFKFDAEPPPKDFSLFRRIGFCNAGETRGELPVKQDPNLGLFPTAENCSDWIQGSPRKDKAKRIRKKKNESDIKVGFGIPEERV